MQGEATPYHIVFCLDDSGSMGGSPWSQLMDAYKLYLDNTTERDTISVLKWLEENG